MMALGRNDSTNPSKGGIYLVIDDGNSGCGLTDRLKTAVGLCYVAQQNGLPFKFIHTAGFDIRGYLKPNRIDWSAELTDISRLPWKTRPLRYLPPYDNFPVFKPGVRYVCRRYIGRNVMEQTGVPDWQRLWRRLFWDMFTPTDTVLDALAAARQELPERYAIVNARFINSLGHAEDASFNAPLPAEMQERLIEAVLARVAECAELSEVPVVVYADSVRFLEAAAQRGFLITNPKGIGNIMNKDATEDVHLKSFVGMLQISEAQTVYSIRHVDGFPENCLYTTQYPKYAAIIGDRPFVMM